MAWLTHVINNIHSTVARSPSHITVVKPSHDQMTKLDLTHHLHMGIIPWALGHWFIFMFILRLLVNLTVDLFLLGNRTCRTFYSVKLGRVLYVASHSTCIMKNSILVFLSIIWVATALLIGTDISDMFLCCAIAMYFSICTNNVSELNRNGLQQPLNVKTTCSNPARVEPLDYKSYSCT